MPTMPLHFFTGYTHDEITKLNIDSINTLPREILTQEISKAASNKQRRFQFKHKA